MAYLGPEGACISCGLLAIRARVRLWSDDWTTHEAMEHARLEGDFWRVDPDRWPGESEPWCVRLRIDFRSAVRGLEAQERRSQTRDAVADPDRHCTDWHLYTPTVSPSEARIEADSMRLEEQRRAWEASEAEARREWAAEQDRALRAWQIEQEGHRQTREDGREKERREFERSLTEQSNNIQGDIKKTGVVGVVIAVVAIAVSGVVTAMFASPTVNNKIVLPPVAPPATATPTVAPSPQSSPGTSGGQP